MIERIHSARFLLLTALLCLLVGSPLSGYLRLRTTSGFNYVWKEKDLPLVFYLDDRTTAALPNIADDSEPVAAISQALQTWNAPSGTLLRLEPLRLTAVEGKLPLGTNGAPPKPRLITFADSPEIREYVGDALALTLTKPDEKEGTILWSVTMFNPQVTFSTKPGKTAFDLQSVAVHEIGHQLGAGHSGIVTSTLYPWFEKGQTQPRSLSPDDEAFLHDAYPGDARGLLGLLQGRVTAAGKAVFGAHVVAFDADNNTWLSTLSQPDGTFEIHGVLPGRYQLFAEPLDGPFGLRNVSGSGDGYYGRITMDFGTAFAGPADSPTILEVQPGSTSRHLEITVASGTPTLNINRAGRAPGKSLEGGTVSNTPFAARPGESFLILLEGTGLFERITSLDQIRILGQGVRLLPNNPVLRVRFGDGTTRGIGLLVEIQRDAAPGPRSILVRDGIQMAVYAGGLEIFSPPEVRQILRIPSFINHSDRYTGFALLNTGKAPAYLAITAYRSNGMRFSGPGFTNPVTQLLEPGTQSALLAYQLFRFPQEFSGDGWIEIESDSDAILGFYLTGDYGLEYLDGAELSSETSRRLLFPATFQTPDLQSDIRVVNPDIRLWAALRLRLYDRKGQLLGSSQRTIPPRGALAVPVSSLFKISNLDYGLLEIDSDVPLLGNQLLSDSASSANAIPTRLAALRAQVPRSADVQIAPQFLSGGGFTSTAFLTNAEDRALRVMVSVIGDDGRALSARLEKNIDPRATLVLNPEDLGLSEAAPQMIEGYLRLEASGSLVGGVLFRDLQGIMLSAMPLLSGGFNVSYFSQVAVGVQGFFTGLACANPNPVSTVLRLEVRDPGGALLGQGTREMAPRSRFSELLEELTSMRGKHQGGYIRITATEPAVCFSLLGTPRSLASVPAQVP